MPADIIAVIPTANRSIVLKKTLESLALQELQPAKIIVVDASENDLTKLLCSLTIPGLESKIVYEKATQPGAACQRNQALEGNTLPVIFFLDDDIELQPGCVKRLWEQLNKDESTGGVNAMITNQYYHPPGQLTKFMYRLMNGKTLPFYAGKCIGPAWNLLPEDKASMPEANEVEWLNTTCTMYKKEALPTPVFPNRFKGYSLLEDLALSLTVAKKWKLYNVRNAKIFHDSQPGSHKKSIIALSRMELVNRHFVMTKILGRTSFAYYGKLFLFELFGITVGLRNITGWKNLIPSLAGKFIGIGTILFTKNNNGQ